MPSALAPTLMVHMHQEVEQHNNNAADVAARAPQPLPHTGHIKCVCVCVCSRHMHRGVKPMCALRVAEGKSLTGQRHAWGPCKARLRRPWHGPLSCSTPTVMEIAATHLGGCWRGWCSAYCSAGGVYGEPGSPLGATEACMMIFDVLVQVLPAHGSKHSA